MVGAFDVDELDAHADTRLEDAHDSERFDLWPLRVSVMRTRVATGSGLLVQTKHPPSEMSEVTPTAREPDSMSMISTSAAKGKRIA